mgnify:CR=1 FL=1
MGTTRRTFLQVTVFGAAVLAIFIAASAREPPHALSSSYCSASPFSDRNFFSIRSISACGMPSDIMLEMYQAGEL